MEIHADPGATGDDSCRENPWRLMSDDKEQVRVVEDLKLLAK